jgi:uncharacterized cupredoxin-like copper-binding protein
MMKEFQRGRLRAAAGILMAITAVCSLPSLALAATVKVTLADQGPDAVMENGLGMGMSGADMAKATMKVTVDPATVDAGRVTFEVTNASKDLVHEMIVAPLGSAAKPLPYDDKNSDVDENAVHSLGEVEERDPGNAGTLTLDLKPGKYVLFCNVPGHYTAGMWTVLTVVSKSG